MQAYIPSTWAMSNIGAIADVVAGGTPKADDKSNFSAPGTGFAWLTPADLSGYMEKYISHGSRDLSEKGLATSSAKLMPAGALLFSSRAPIGYVAIAANEISTNQGFKNFVFTNEIVPTYAYFYLKSIRGLAESLGTGTTFKEISGATAKTLPFVIPPFAEQKEIADRLDTLQAQVEATQARLTRIPDIIKQFRQSVLAAAVSGKLTEEWRAKNNNLDIKSYINDIEKCRKQAHEKENERLRVNRNYKPPVIGEIPSNIALPVGWALLSVDQIAAKITDGVHKKPNYISSGIPFVTVKNMTKGKGISFDDLNYISLEDHQEYCKRTNPKKGDILISKDGTLGVIRKVDVDFEFSIFVSVALVKPAYYAMSDYLEIVFQSPFVQKQMVGVGTGLQHIHLTDLRKDMLPIPPSEEQAEIVRRVEQLFTYADSIEQQAKAAKARVDNLTQAILAKAFRGELTADWRAANPDLISGDNSAAALLARIQAERTTASGKKGKRGTSKTRTTD